MLINHRFWHLFISIIITIIWNLTKEGMHLWPLLLQVWSRCNTHSDCRFQSTWHNIIPLGFKDNNNSPKLYARCCPNCFYVVSLHILKVSSYRWRKWALEGDSRTPTHPVKKTKQAKQNKTAWDLNPDSLSPTSSLWVLSPTTSPVLSNPYLISITTVSAAKARRNKKPISWDLLKHCWLGLLDCLCSNDE